MGKKDTGSSRSERKVRRDNDQIILPHTRAPEIPTTQVAANRQQNQNKTSTNNNCYARYQSRFGESDEGANRSIKAPPRQYSSSFSDEKKPAAKKIDKESSYPDESSSILSAESSAAETLDLVLTKKYPSSEENGFTAQPLSSSLQKCAKLPDQSLSDDEKKPGKVIVDDHIAGLVCDMMDKENEKAYHSKKTTTTSRRSDHDDVSSTDTMSIVPPPPTSLQQQRHISQPGAFRMSMGGIQRPADTDSLISISTFSQRPSRPRQQIIEASPVEDRIPNDDDDEECPSPHLNFTSSMGTTATHMTAATTTTTSPVVEAHPMDDSQTIRAFFRSRKVRAVVCFLALFFLILILGAVYGVTGFGLYNDKSGTSFQSEAPTGAPTSTGDLDLEYFAQVVLPENTRQQLRKENSPQAKALSWLRSNKLLSTYSLSQRLQRFVLATLFYSTGGERRWMQKEGWLSDEDECSWFTGIETKSAVCNIEGAYRYLKLGSNQLRGTIPDELSLLSSLEVLDMSENILTGFVPTTMKRLTKLREIRLFDNFISGKIPDLRGMDRLEILDVEFNFIAQTLPDTITELQNLNYLLLDRNLLVGSIPSQLNKLTNLQVFYVFSNGLSGTLPPDIGSIPTLTSIVAYENFLSGTIPTELFKIQDLQEMNLGNNTFSGAIPSEVGSLEQLEVMDLFDNELTGSIPSEIGKLTNARVLYFEKNNLKGELPTEIGNLETCSVFWLHENKLEGSIPSEIGRVTTLKDLNLSQNFLSGYVPSEIGLLTNVENLFLNSNSFSGKIPSELGRLTNLRRLALDDNFFTGTMPEEVCRMVETGSLEMESLTVDCALVQCSCCKNCTLSELGNSFSNYSN